MRGKDEFANGGRSKSGITPAYAGKSTKYEYGERELGDHPRLCGEKFHNAYNSPLRLGSPPPMRGKVVHGSMLRTTSRITPAYAGKSIRKLCHPRQGKDHPRLCGEKAHLRAVSTKICRITPAYAGKSPFSPAVRYTHQDHPRLCGEKDTITKLKKAG